MAENLLSNIKSHHDLCRLDTDQLVRLAAEIRQLIKTTVSTNGGHLASNLGAVELTIALHYVFDFAHDRIVWDVGHQCYVHKILTGRAERFDSLRQGGGISGFPNPAESPTDQFAVGHAGTAIASSLGLALGAQMTGSNERVVAVVGDASIVNGLSFEGLNNTSLVHRQLLIILNDNSMAIDKTEGAFAKYLTRLRVSRSYEDLQRRTRLMVRNLPYFGTSIQDALDRIKGGIKSTLQSRQIFEQLGIPYFGPVDGHDIGSLTQLLAGFKDIDHPVLLHVQTEKGRGFEPAHQDPCTFHSPKPFKVNGQTASFPRSTGKSFTSAFASSLAELMKNDHRIVALTAAMPDGTGLAQLRTDFPDRIIDVGIAESAAVDIAAGLAKTGMRPVVAIYSTFMQRAFDQVFQEVALQNLPVIFCLDRAGLVGSDGAVHHGFCDIALLRTLPNMILMAPTDQSELAGALSLALGSNCPCVLRYPRDTVPATEAVTIEQKSQPFQLGRAAILRQGGDAAVIAYGSSTYQAALAAETLAQRGIEVAVHNARFAKPLDEALLRSLLAIENEYPIVIVEDHALVGGFGSAILEFAQSAGLDTRRIVRIGLPDRFIAHNSRAAQLAEVGLDTQGIIAAICRALGKPEHHVAQSLSPQSKVTTRT